MNIEECWLQLLCADGCICLLCRAMKPDDLSPEAGVPAQVKQDVSEFWVCGTCGKVYWQGNQYGNALSRLTTRLDNLKLRPPPERKPARP